MKSSSQSRLFLAGALALVAAGHAVAQSAFTAGDLLVSGSIYQGTASTVIVGQPLPGASGGLAIANGTYPNVFSNDSVDASFGVTSPIIINEITTTGSTVQSLNITQMAANEGVNLVTSFPSKSEIALNVSADGTAVTFMDYIAPVNTLDVSNSNTPNHVDPTNPVAQTYQRSVAQLNFNGTLTISPNNTYTGNNGRAAVLDNGNYYMVGNGGNGSGTEPVNVVNNTGVQMIAQGATGEATVVGLQQGTPGSSTGFEYGFSVAQSGVGLTADKSGKDDNFRGLTLFNNTLYVSKGSGGNGIDTVYQVNPSGGGYVNGALGVPTAANAAATTINVLPGFNLTSAKTAVSPTNPASNPFGLWFANANTLYVADEGDGIAADLTNGNDPNSGLQKWIFSNGTWKLAYTLQTGLSLGVAYTVNGYTGPAPANDGLRNITGKVNGDGTVTIYGIASTVSTLADQGADPNGLYDITDTLADSTSTQALGEAFSLLEAAQNGQVLRGVSFVPQASAIPEPSTYAGIFGLMVLGGAGWIRRRNGRRA